MENRCNHELLHPGLSGLLFLGATVLKVGVSILFSGRAVDRSRENRMEDGVGRVNYMLFYLFSFITCP